MICWGQISNARQAMENSQKPKSSWRLFRKHFSHGIQLSFQHTHTNSRSPKQAAHFGSREDTLCLKKLHRVQNFIQRALHRTGGWGYQRCCREQNAVSLRSFSGESPVCTWNWKPLHLRSWRRRPYFMARGTPLSNIRVTNCTVWDREVGTSTTWIF